MNGSKMFTSLNTNPVEVAGLITALAGTFFVMLFAFRTDKLRERLPSLELLDGLMYKTACLAFAGLAMLLITGAIWANESWGRPWGFDSKETGALIAWLTYAGFYIREFPAAGRAEVRLTLRLSLFCLSFLHIWA
jgi:ABC-type transport system involved in cytochrome c biogenesis permease subunit